MTENPNIDSIIFRHLTGREKPKLIHPTNREFDAGAWGDLLKSIEDTQLKDRDYGLCHAALLIAHENDVLRQQYIDRIFSGFSPEQIGIFAVAHANYSFLQCRQKMYTLFKEHAESEKRIDLSSLSQEKIKISENLDPVTADQINTAVVDTLPHWFPFAKASHKDRRAVENNLGNIAQQMGSILSMEHGLRTIWQEMLWEDWRISKNSEDDWTLEPGNVHWQANWLIWSMRDQTLLLQRSIFNRDQETQGLTSKEETALPKTVVGIDFKVTPPKLTIGVPDKGQTIAHRHAFDTLNDSYTKIFSDQEVSNGGVTVSLLSRATVVIQDLAEISLPQHCEIAHLTWSEMKGLACCVSCEMVVEAVSKSLDITSELAASCVAFLTSDPETQLSDMFRIGVWHRPLIAMPDGIHLAIVAGALIEGSVIRRTERWLQMKSGNDLSKTSNGMIYERHVREVISEALSRNRIISEEDYAIAHLSQGQSKEEIDLLVKVGKLVFVCEIKCLLTPADPSERYDYVRKLEKAAEQASRKAAWLQKELSLTRKLFSGNKTLKMVPLVVVNQSAGLGLVFGDCQITDVHFLKIVLSGGEYGYAAQFSGKGRPISFMTRLYSSLSEAEAVLPGVFTENRNIQRYREAIRLGTHTIQLSSAFGKKITWVYPVVDEEAYQKTYPSL